VTLERAIAILYITTVMDTHNSQAEASAICPINLTDNGLAQILRLGLSVSITCQRSTNRAGIFD
jgi:hypothetical protein